MNSGRWVWVCTLLCGRAVKQSEMRLFALSSKGRGAPRPWVTRRDSTPMAAAPPAARCAARIVSAMGSCMDLGELQGGGAAARAAPPLPAPRTSGCRGARSRADSTDPLLPPVFPCLPAAMPATHGEHLGVMRGLNGRCCCLCCIGGGGLGGCPTGSVRALAAWPPKLLMLPILQARPGHWRGRPRHYQRRCVCGRVSSRLQCSRRQGCLVPLGAIASGFNASFSSPSTASSAPLRQSPNDPLSVALNKQTKNCIPPPPGPPPQ